MQNRRQYMRTASDAVVEIKHPTIGAMTVKAKDLSDGGISIDMGSHVIPPLGTEFSVIIKRHTGAINAEPVKMKVMHTEANGLVGLMFVAS